MKIKKDGLNNMGGNYSLHEYGFISGLNVKIANYFWKFVDILSCKMDKIAKLYEKSIGKEYKKESMVFDISNAKSILHIGCGAYPITAMTLAKINDAKIVGIDRNPKSIKLAKDVVKEKNLQVKITIEQGDGTNYPLKEFDTIIISGCSYPKKQILKHAFENAKPQSRIIFRASDHPESLLSCIDLCKNITIVKKIKNYPLRSSKAFGWQSFCIVKK